MTLLSQNTVTRIRRMQPKKTSGSLLKRTGGDTFAAGVAYANMYVPPSLDVSGIGGSGIPTLTGDIYLYQEGESAAPEPDDKITTANGSVFQVFDARASINFVPNWAVHRCTVLKIG